MAVIHPDQKSLFDEGSSLKFVYPVQPNKLQLFTKYGFVDRPKTSAVRYLEHMLTKTTLTTQKAVHSNIEEIGEKLHDKQVQKYREQEEAAVALAEKKTTQLMRKEQQKLLQLAAHNAAVEKEAALMNQKHYYEELARRTKEGRDQLEEEKISRVVCRKEKEKELALEKQWQEAEKLKKEAIERVLKEQHKRLRASAALEREKAIASALSVAREKFAQKLEKEIEATREDCEQISQKMMKEAEKLHQIEIQRLNERIATLNQEMSKMREKQLHAQKDFIDMENDYSRFLDFAPHPCRSEYLLLSRRFSHGVERQRCSRTSQTDLMAFEQRSIAVETNVKIPARS